MGSRRRLFEPSQSALAKVHRVCSRFACRRSANKLRLSGNRKTEENEGSFLRLTPVSGSSFGHLCTAEPAGGSSLHFPVCLVARWLKTKAQQYFITTLVSPEWSANHFFPKGCVKTKLAKGSSQSWKPRRNYFNTLRSPMLLWTSVTLWFLWSGWRRAMLLTCCVRCSRASSQRARLVKTGFSRRWMLLFSSVYFGINLYHIVVSMLLFFFQWFLPNMLGFAPGCTVFRWVVDIASMQQWKLFIANT